MALLASEDTVFDGPCDCAMSSRVQPISYHRIVCRFKLGKMRGENGENKGNLKGKAQAGYSWRLCVEAIVVVQILQDGLHIDARFVEIQALDVPGIVVTVPFAPTVRVAGAGVVAHQG